MTDSEDSGDDTCRRKRRDSLTKQSARNGCNTGCNSVSHSDTSDDDDGDDPASTNISGICSKLSALSKFTTLERLVLNKSL